MEFTGQFKGVSIDYETGKPLITFSMNEKEELEYLEDIKNVDKLKVTANKYRNKRSLDANAYFHVLVNKLARKMKVGDDEMKKRLNLDYGTVARNVDGTKVGVEVPKGTDIDKFYPYAKWYGERQVGDLMFDKYLFYKPTHELDTKEMSDLIDGVVEECKQVGIETLPPAELESMMKGWNVK